MLIRYFLIYFWIRVVDAFALPHTILGAFPLCYLAVVVKVVCYPDDDVAKFEVLCVFAWNTGKHDFGSDDVAGDCSSGVAVTFVIDRGDQSLVEVVRVFKCAVDNYRQRFFFHLALSKCIDRVEVVYILFGKADSLMHEFEVF